MRKIFIDGKLVPESEIDPAKHTYIGQFRPPYKFAGGGYVLCDCGRTLQTVDEVFHHYQSGHWDTAQYQTIKT